MSRILHVLLLICLFGCSKQDTSSSKVLRVAADVAPSSLDPRSARILADATVLNMLYEGLMRVTPDGQVVPGIAESVSISEDRLTYTFHLRQALWSDGSPVTAQDFAASWLYQLSPAAPAPNANMLYVIKHAQNAKTGTQPLSSVGIEAKDASTLIVSLEQPTPYFLDLTAFYAYFPFKENAFNGPFTLKHYSPNSGLEASKNYLYWDADAIRLDGVNIILLDDSTALSLFEAKGLDWVGSPLSTLPAESLDSLPFIQSSPAAATHLFRINVNNAPLDNPKLRRALALAINRRELVEHVIKGNQSPAMGIIPKGHRWPISAHFLDHDAIEAKKLFIEATTNSALPTLTFMYKPNEREHKIAQVLQQQWHQNLGIWVELQAVETKLLLERLRSGNYSLANGSWFADFNDPINFLSVFESLDNGTNNTGWDSPTFKKLLADSATAFSEEKRRRLLIQAEELLMAEMPIVPIFYYNLNYVKAPNVHGVGITPLGIQVFRDGWID